MMNDDLISIREAAILCGRSKKLLQSLVERGALPAVRRGDKWLVSRADLARLYDLRPAAPEGPNGVKAARPLPPPQKAADDAASERRADVSVLLELLRQRDDQVLQLQHERAHLSAQIGFLQGLLVERAARLRVLEAAPATRTLQAAEDPAPLDPVAASAAAAQTTPTGAEAPAAPAAPAPPPEAGAAGDEPLPAPLRPAEMQAGPPSRRSTAVLLVRRLLGRRQ